MYLDLSKAFDTINYDILINKLKHYGIKGNSLNLFKNYLSNRSQFVSVNDVNSEKRPISTGVPQGSILGPLLFLIYINDMVFASEIFASIMYADDTTLSCTVNFKKSVLTDISETELNNELQKISTWLKLNKLSLNVSKTKFMIFHTPTKKVSTPKLMIDDSVIERVTEFNFLGINVHENLNWSCHTTKIANKISRTIGILNKLKRYLPLNIKIMIYNALIASHLNYGILIWGYQPGRLIKLQKRAIRTINVSKYNAHTEPL